MTHGNAVYAVTMVLGVATSAFLWRRLVRTGGRAPDPRLAAIYAGALVGAYLGAKAAFLVAEGWAFRHDWVALLSGHSVTGALLGGVVGVEATKSMLGYREGTGDLFAVTVPVAIAIGRAGCAASGCCQGIECEASWWTATDAHGHARWPAPVAELAFNLAFLAWATVAARRGWQRGQRFNDYLMAYGCFRFAHEFVRDDSRWWGPVGGYHVLALALVATGAWMHARRRATGVTPSPAA